jgi:hypothetical protein
MSGCRAYSLQPTVLVQKQMVEMSKLSLPHTSTNFVHDGWSCITKVAKKKEGRRPAELFPVTGMFTMYSNSEYLIYYIMSEWNNRDDRVISVSFRVLHHGERQQVKYYFSRQIQTTRIIYKFHNLVDHQLIYLAKKGTSRISYYSNQPETKRNNDGTSTS